MVGSFISYLGRISANRLSELRGMQAKRQPARTGNKIKETISLAVSGTIELGELFKSFGEEAREKEKGKKRRMPVLWVHHHPQQNLASTYPSTQWTTLNQKSPRQHRSSPPVCVRLCPSVSVSVFVPGPRSIFHLNRLKKGKFGD